MFNPEFHKSQHKSLTSELKTLEWWISRSMLDLLYFLISRLNNACSPIAFNLQIKLPIGIKDIPFQSFQLWEVCHKLKFYNLNILAAWWCQPLIFQTTIIWSNQNLYCKYLRYTTLGCTDIEIRKSEFVVKIQLFYCLH